MRLVSKVSVSLAAIWCLGGVSAPAPHSRVTTSAACAPRPLTCLAGTGLIQMLLPRLKDERPMVRVITCWTLGRYVPALLMPPGGPPPNHQAAPPPVSPAVAGLLDAVLSGLLERVVERNRWVRVAPVGRVGLSSRWGEVDVHGQTQVKCSAARQWAAPSPASRKEEGLSHGNRSPVPQAYTVVQGSVAMLLMLSMRWQCYHHTHMCLLL
jgi:hypothetical protein